MGVAYCVSTPIYSQSNFNKQENTMDLQALELRMTDMLKAIEQSAANHNSLIGRLEECRFLYEEAKKEAAGTEVEAPVEVVHPAE